MSFSDLHTGIHSLPLIYLRIIEIVIAAFSILMQLFNSAIELGFATKTLLFRNTKNQKYVSPKTMQTMRHPLNGKVTRVDIAKHSLINIHYKLYFHIILYDKETHLLKWHNIIIVANGTTVTSVNKSII